MLITYLIKYLSESRLWICINLYIVAIYGSVFLVYFYLNTCNNISSWYMDESFSPLSCKLYSCFLCYLWYILYFFYVFPIRHLSQLEPFPICLVKLLMLDIVYIAQLSFFDCMHILVCAHTHALNMSPCLHVVRCYEAGFFIWF